jgi:uncharacterized protein YebE (UPF0316 family)
MTLILYFLLGVVQDFLIAKYYLALSRRLVIVASSLGALITGLTFVVIDLSFGRADRIVAYAVGTGVGTMLALRGRK